VVVLLLVADSGGADGGGASIVRGWVGGSQRERKIRGGDVVEVDALYSYSTPCLLQLFVSQLFIYLIYLFFCLCSSHRFCGNSCFV
jgi:hypothetical protein